MRTELEIFAQQILGPCRAEKDWSWGHGGSRVLELRGRDGVTWYAKRHRKPEQYEREVTAYRRWVPALGDRAPRLRASDDGLRALLLSALPGTGVHEVLLTAEKPASKTKDTAVEGAGLSRAGLVRAGLRAGLDHAVPPDAVDLHRQAGVLLRRFHDSEPLPPWSGFAAEKQAELERWAAHADGIVDRAELDFVRAELRALDAFPEPTRVPCHLDYTPRNWLVDNGRLFVIDFEWAAPEVWVNDLARLYFGPWRGRPDLAEAFLDGYGRMPDADDLALLHRCFALRAVWMRIWAHAHGELAFASALREVLHTLMHAESA